MDIDKDYIHPTSLLAKNKQLKECLDGIADLYYKAQEELGKQDAEIIALKAEIRELKDELRYYDPACVD